MKKHALFIIMVAIYITMGILAGLAGVFSGIAAEYEVGMFIVLALGVLIGASLGGIFPYRISSGAEKYISCLMMCLLQWIVAALLGNKLEFFHQILLAAEFILVVITFFVLKNLGRQSTPGY